MSKSKDREVYTITPKQAKLVTDLAAKVLNAIWCKDGLQDLETKLSEAKQGIAGLLMVLYTEAERVGNGNGIVAESCFKALCQSYEAQLVLLDAKQNANVKRAVKEIQPSWPAMKSEMLRALKNQVSSVEPQTDKPRTYADVKAARMKVDPSVSRVPRTPEGKKPETSVTEKLAGVLTTITNMVVSMDATQQDTFADILHEAIQSLKQEAKTHVDKAKRIVKQA